MMSYFLKSKGKFISYIIITIVYYFVFSMMAYVVQFILDSGTNKDMESLYRSIVYTIIFMITMFSTNFLHGFFENRLMKNIMLKLKNDIYNKIFNQSINKYSKNTTSYYLSFFLNEVPQLETNYFTAICSLISQITWLIISIVLMANINIYVFLLTLFLSMLPLAIPFIFKKIISTKKLKYMNSREKYIASLKDYFSSFTLIKSYNMGKRMEEIHEEKNTNLFHIKRSSETSVNLSNNITLVITLAINVAILLFCTYLKLSGVEGMTLGTAFAASVLANGISEPSRAILRSINQLGGVSLIKEKINKFLNESDKQGGIELNSFNGSIKIKDLSFGYTENKKIIDDVNFVFENKKKYAIVGESGSGKSTFLNLLLGHFDKYEGEIDYNDTELRDINLDSLYTNISLIRQNVFIFNGSIKYNLAFNDDKYSDEELVKALSEAGLSEFLEKHNGNLESDLGEGGKLLSGGEKQRISIARAFLKDSNLIFMDEATAALDNKISYNIDDLVLSQDDKTVIYITHRLNEDILRKFDSILVFHKGKICECGSYDDLIGKEGIFHSFMYATQN